MKGKDPAGHRSAPAEGFGLCKKDKIHCDFSEESPIMMKLDLEKQIIYYGDQPMVKQ